MTPQRTQYWPTSDRTAAEIGVRLEARAGLAFQLLTSGGGNVCTGNIPAGSLVQRAFEIADQFLDAAYQRGEARTAVEIGTGLHEGARVAA